LTENSNLRASYNKTLARPSFREKSVAQIFDPISKITFLGNIDIEQTNIDNVDLRWETFPNRGEVISVSGFYKRFDGHIELAVFETAVDNLKPVNSGISQVFGIELEARKALNFISDMSRVVSIGGNISIVESRMDMATVVLPGNTESELDIRRQSARDGETIDQYRTMAGQSPFLINAYLNVSNSEKGIDANLSYNVQGRTLSIVGLGLIPDVYAAPRHLINLRFAKQIGSKGRSSISLRMNNLLDQDRLLSYDSFNAPEETYSRFSDGRDFIIGYRYNLR
jgi:outer membrane receptor protein involved in Fe transport